MFAASKTDSASTGGYQISRSLRFNPTDTAYLSRTPATATNRTTWTWSAWVKISGQNQSQYGMFSARGPSSSVPATTMGLLSTNSFVFSDNGTGGFFTTTQLFRDLSAWYHIVMVADTTQATDTNRIKLYVNGLQVTSFSSITYPAQNSEFAINTTLEHNTGKYSNSGNYVDGYMTEINFIDGQALTSSSFGETNAQTGVWQPKAYSGSYGTNGFYLNFSDNSNTTAATLGKDYSGNGNNWTPNNFSVTAGAGNDAMVDVPTPYGVDTGVGGTVRGNYATFNPLTTTRTITNGNLYTEVNGGGGSNVPISLSMALPTTGKWYWEITAGGPAGGGNGGWDWGIVASSTPNFRLANLLIAGTTGCYGVNGNSGTLVANATTAVAGYISGGIANGDIAQIAYDADTGKLWLGKNNTWGSNGGVGNPAAGTNAGITSLSGEFIPVFEYASDSGTISATLNTGQRPFAYTAPSGFKALCTQNLPTPTIGATSATQAGKFFNPVLYTGNGGTNNITGVGFQPDWVWIKSRNDTYNPQVYDVLRGTNNRLVTASTNAEFADTDALTSFNSDGFTSGAEAGMNANAISFVAWNWKANGTGVSNTSGSITSTVSASTTSGFSIVTWTGTGVAATVGHGLGVAPSMIFVKQRTNQTGYNWFVYNQTIGNTQWLILNDTRAASSATNAWNNTSPTSTVFSVSGYDEVNRSTSTFVAYCFAPVAGYSAIGSYTGNGSSDGPFIYTGFRPRYIMIKMTSGTNNWSILDTSRSPYNLSTQILAANIADAEYTTADTQIDILSNGVKLRCTTFASGINQSGGTYIFAAFAENPFKYSLARQD